MNEVILFAACLFSFSAGLISLLFSLRFKKAFFFHVFLITVAFFLISAESFFVTLHGAITSKAFFCIFGGMLSFVFSYGMISFGLDFIQISLSSRIRMFIPIYSAAVLAFAISIIFINAIEHLANIYRKVGVKNRLELFSRLKND